MKRLFGLTLLALLAGGIFVAPTTASVEDWGIAHMLAHAEIWDCGEPDPNNCGSNQHEVTGTDGDAYPHGCQDPFSILARSATWG